MKKYIYTLLFMIVSIVLTAQSFSMEERLFQEEIKELFPTYNSSFAHFRTNPVKRLDSLVMSYVDPYYNGAAQKRVYEYDATNNSITEKGFQKMDATAPWIPTFMIEQVYDLNDNLIDRSLYVNWSTTTNTFGYGTRKQTTYNNNAVIETIELYLDGATQTWENVYKNTMVYNSVDILTEMARQSWSNNNNQWQDLTTTYYTYNANQLVAFEEVFWTTSGNQNGKTEFTYDSNNWLVQRLTLDFVNGAYENFSKIDITRTTTGEFDTYEKLNWDNNAWVYQYKFDYDYDQMNNLTSTTYYELDYTTQTLVPYDQGIYTYNNNLPYEVLQTSLSERECRHQLLTLTANLYNSNSGMFEAYYDGTYYWTDLMTAVSEPLFSGSEHISAYPNPATELLQFDLAPSSDQTTIELYNANGQQVLQTQLSDNQVQLPNLPTGFYNYLIRQNEKAYSGKVIID